MTTTTIDRSLSLTAPRPSLLDRWRDWRRHRRQVRVLRELEPAMLRDIGLDPRAVQRELARGLFERPDLRALGLQP